MFFAFGGAAFDITGTATLVGSGFTLLDGFYCDYAIAATVTWQDNYAFTPVGAFGWRNGNYYYSAANFLEITPAAPATAFRHSIAYPNPALTIRM